MLNTNSSRHAPQASDLRSALQEWAALPGVRKVLAADAALARYGVDTGGATRRLAGALLIEDAVTLPEVVRIAARHQVPLHPISTGRNWGYGTALPATDDCVVVDLSALQRIIDFDPVLGVVSVEPGVTQGMLAHFLDEGGHDYMVPVTGAGPDASLVGNALERGYGITPIADHFAAVTDIEAVLADGSVFRTSLAQAGCDELARLFKWGVGPYVTGLFTQGGFGIVTRVTLLLARRPECVRVGLFSLPDDDALDATVARVRQILARLPGIVGGVNLMNRRRILAMVAPYPHGEAGPDGLLPDALIARMGAAHQVMPWTGFMTLYGTPKVVRAAQHEIRRTLAPLARRLIFVGPGLSATLLTLARRLPAPWGPKLQATASTLNSALELAHGRPNRTALPLAFWRGGGIADAGPATDPAADIRAGLLWYAPLVPMRPDAVRAAVNLIESVARRHGIEPLITLTSVGERLFDSTVPLLFDRTNPEAVRSATQCWSSLVGEGQRIGIFPYRFGVDGMGLAREVMGRAWHHSDALRRAWDVQDLLSPGRYGSVLTTTANT